MNPCVFRTASPDVLDVVLAAEEAETARRAQIKKFLEDNFPGEDRSAMFRSGWGSTVFVGVSTIDSDWDALPAGWRREKGRGISYLVPYRAKGKAVKAVVEGFNAIPRLIDPRWEWPGLPKQVRSTKTSPGGVMTMTTPGSHWDADRSHIYAVFGEHAIPDPADVDTAIWEPLMLSEYHRLKEAGEFPDLGEQG